LQGPNNDVERASATDKAGHVLEQDNRRQEAIDEVEEINHALTSRVRHAGAPIRRPLCCLREGLARRATGDDREFTALEANL
jgi:hypothetical protein